MKIIDKENNILYLQVMDINYIIKNSDVPKKLVYYINDSLDKTDFVKIYDNEIFDYVKKLEYILDYNEYITMNYDELKQKTQKTYDEMNNILNKYSKMSKIDKKNSGYLRKKYYDKDFIIQSLSVIYEMQKHNIKVKKKVLN